MKILMTCFNIVGRGTYLRALKLATSLQQQGHQLTILATNSSGSKVMETWVDGVLVVTAPGLLQGSLRSGWDVYDILRRIFWLRGHNFDIVHAFESRPTAIYPALYMQKKGTALFTDWCDWFGRGGSVEERPNPVIRAVLRPVETFYEEHFRPYALGTTVICSTLYARAVQLGISPRTVLQIPNGLDVTSIKPMNRMAARRALGLADADFMIGYVGASFKRDLELMLSAFDQIVQQIPTAKLVHIGRTNYDAPPGGRVVSTGSISETQLNLYLAACNVCWLPLSDTNANRGRFPLKLSNYLAAGRPVVATSVGDLRPFFHQHMVGLLANPDPNDLTTQIVRLFRDPDLAEGYGRNARLTSEDPQNGWSQRAEELQNHYKQLT